MMAPANAAMVRREYASLMHDERLTTIEKESVFRLLLGADSARPKTVEEGYFVTGALRMLMHQRTREIPW